ncbi:hypothetical protein [Prevotella sp.]|uniref:hypothetical protein n=1 Tax=Prevotella sp. TaxID=59823 RepID=UPI003AF9686F
MQQITIARNGCGIGAGFYKITEVSQVKVVKKFFAMLKETSRPMVAKKFLQASGKAERNHWFFALFIALKAFGLTS